MSHMLSVVNGRVELAYAGDPLWHALGTKVEGLQTAEAMLGHAEMLWTVSARPAWTEASEGSGPTLAVPRLRVIVRDDTGVAMGWASKGYMPIQNLTAGKTVDYLMAGGACVEITGAIDEGRRCWMLARVGDAFEVVKGDELLLYVLLAWGHDGKHGVAGKRTPIRVCCKNTLGAALGNRWSKTADFFVKHSASASIGLEQAREALRLVLKGRDEDQAAYRALAAHTMADSDVAAYFARIFEEPDKAATGYEERLARWTAVQERLVALYQGGQGSQIPGVRGTAWGAYNAVTEYVDHVYPVLQSGKVSAERQQSAAFGTYATVKADALAAALALV